MDKHNFTLHFVVLFCLAASSLKIVSCAANTQEPQIRQLALTLSGSSDGFDDDTVVSFGGGDLGGVAIIWLNGDPITIHDSGGTLVPLNHWMIDGTNSVKITGNFKQPLYLKIVRMKGNEVEEVLAKKVVKPDDKQTIDAAKFLAKVDWTLPSREKLPTGNDQLRRIEVEISAIVSELKRTLLQHEGALAASRLNAGSKLWANPAYGRSETSLADEFKAATEYFSNKDLIVEENETPLQIVLGERSVLVWRRQAIPRPLFLF